MTLTYSTRTPVVVLGTVAKLPPAALPTPSVPNIDRAIAQEPQHDTRQWDDAFLGTSAYC